MFASQDWLRWQKFLVLLPISEYQNTASDKISARRLSLLGYEGVLLSCSASSANYFQSHAIN